MKILMLIDSFTVGGAQKQFCTLAKELHKRYNLTVVVYHSVTSHFEDELKVEGVRIIKILKRSRFDIAFIIKLLIYIRKGQFDVSISFLDTPNFYNVIAKITGSINKIIVSQRSAYFKKSITLRKRIQESLLFFADSITTNSITQKQRMEEIFPFMKGKLYYLPNAYKTSRSYYSLNSNSFVVLSNLNENKNPLRLVLAVEILVCKYSTKNFTINWYGRYPITEKAKIDFSRAQNIIRTKNLDNYIKFKGITSNPTKVINECSALIHISDYEGTSNSVCEAMALSKPIILSNICDHPILVSYNNGILVDHKTPGSIAAGILQYINMNLAERQKMGMKSKYYISKNHNINNTLNILNKIL